MRKIRTLLHRLKTEKGRPSLPDPDPDLENFSVQPDLAGRRNFFTEHILIHTHVPKTAGTTLFTGLSAIVGGVNATDLRVKCCVPLDQMTHTDLAKLHLVSGHFRYGTNHRYFDRQPLYFAAVREPVERAVSYYRFLCDHPENNKHYLVEGRSFEEAWHLMDDLHAPSERNRQSRMIAGTKQGEPIAPEFLEKRFDQDYFLIIPQKKMSRALNKMRAAFGLPWFKMPRENVSQTKRVEPDPALRDRILEVNAMDAMLYERAEAEFDTRLAQACTYIAQHCLRPLDPATSAQKGPQ